MKKLFYSALIASLAITFNACSDDDNKGFEVLEEETTPPEVVESDGFYVVNEDWFGHDNGTVNFFKKDGTIEYRAYRAANENSTLGVTTCYGTIYGDNVYFVSKQRNRLVVADAKTLKQKAIIENINGDGRAFVGVSEDKGYIGTGGAISIFDIKSLTVIGKIADIDKQVGNMCAVGNRVFAIVQGKGTYVINSVDDEVETLIAGAHNTLTLGYDGTVWIGAGNDLIGLNPYTLKQTVVDVASAPIKGSWGAWNPGSLCASTQENTLYWTKGRSVVKFDVKSKTVTPDLYTLGVDSENVQLAFYGAALRVDPSSDNLVLLVKRNGWGASGSYNWIHIVSNKGELVKDIKVLGDNGTAGASGAVDEGYFWFPSMPMFQDINKPKITINRIAVSSGTRTAISLSARVRDIDNTSASIMKTLTFDPNETLVDYAIKEDSLIITSKEITGESSFIFKANSNGQIVTKEVKVEVLD